MADKEVHPVPRVCVASFDSAGRILLLKRTDGYYKGFWEVPGGKQILWERSEKGVSREFLEETGIRIPASKFEPLFFIDAMKKPISTGSFWPFS